MAAAGATSSVTSRSPCHREARGRHGDCQGGSGPGSPSRPGRAGARAARQPGLRTRRLPGESTGRQNGPVEGLSGRRQRGEGLLRERVPDREFTRFVERVEPRLSYAFYAAYGPEVGSEVTAVPWPTPGSTGTRLAAWTIRPATSTGWASRRPAATTGPGLFPHANPADSPRLRARPPRRPGGAHEAQRQAVILVYAWSGPRRGRGVAGKSRSTLRTTWRGPDSLRQSWRWPPMADLRLQLRAYVEATVERVDVADVLAARAVRPEPAAEHPWYAGPLRSSWGGSLRC